MTAGEAEMKAQALGWATRVGDPSFADWEGFTQWLEADTRHAPLYHALEAEIAEAAAILGAPPTARLAPVPSIAQGRGAAPDEMRPAGGGGMSRRYWLGGAIAASLAGIIGWTAWDGAPARRTFETAYGERHQIRLADGSRIALNGGTRLVLEGGADARSAVLERGEALFIITHDENRPFRVVSGQDEIVDVGTVFAVQRAQDFVAVQVADGMVIFNPAGEKVTLGAGRGLVSDAQGVRVSAVEPGAVGGFDRGRLDYSGAPIATVLDDVRRATGAAITADPVVAARPFHGTIRLDGVAGDPARLGPLLGLSIRREDGRWRARATP